MSQLSITLTLAADLLFMAKGGVDAACVRLTARSLRAAKVCLGLAQAALRRDRSAARPARPIASSGNDAGSGIGAGPVMNCAVK